MRRRLGIGCLAVLAFAGRAHAEQDLIAGSRGRLAVGGYALTLGGVQVLRYELGANAPSPPPPDHLGLSASVLRLEWKADLGERVTVEVHQRGFLRVSSEGVGATRLGLGASAAPRRTVNLRSVAYDEDRLLLEHDIDRLAVRAALGNFDLALGRQAITWGFASLFPVADLWTTFSPFELDTSQKRGVDALRMNYSASQRLEIEAVLADRGSLRDLSAGLRAVAYLAAADLYLGFTKQWRELMALGGVGVVLGSFKLHADAIGPYDLDRRDLSPPRLTVGADWLRPSLTLTLEAHYNGTGVTHADDYVTHLTSSPIVARGESYLLGRWYTGAAASWKLSELFALGLTLLGNLQDPSLVCAAALTYHVSQETALAIGAFQGVGRRPLLDAAPDLRSEFGAVGSLYYLSLSAFY
jgi:hypothetical protein